MLNILILSLSLSKMKRENFQTKDGTLVLFRDYLVVGWVSSDDEIQALPRSVWFLSWKI